MSYSPTLLKGQKALITGSSSGIGEAAARSLAKAGAAVLVNYRSEKDAAEKIVSDILGDGGEAIAVGADVSKEEDVLRMFDQMYQAFGGIDILVSNAGLQKDSAFVDMTLDQWNTVLNVNLTGQFLCIREAAKQFLKQGVKSGLSCAAGKVICMSSVHQIIPWAGHVNYASSKGGLEMMMKSVAQELAPHKIRVNSIAPGAIQTQINTEAWNTPEAKEKLLKLIPYNRVGMPDDIGKAVVWLASDDSDYVTGTTLFVDGGMTLYPEFARGG